MRNGMFNTMLLVLSTMLLAAAASAEETVYGAGVSANDTILVSDLMANPDAHVDKVIRVTGTAVAVCQHRGCWVELASDVEGETVRVKVTDGEIVFPLEMQGETVTAEGVWTKIDLDLETTKAICENQAKKAGEKFDPDSVTSCMTVWQITGTGAVASSDHDHGHDHDDHGHDHDDHDHDHGDH